jgi:hypothetical protein
MWAGGHAESSGAGVTLLDWLNVMVKESDGFKVIGAVEKQNQDLTA